MPAILPDQGPLAIYRARRAAGDLMPDPSQELAAEKLQSLWRALLDYKPATGMRGWAARVGLGVAEPPQGLYLCGPVGRGKTMLMDMFYESLGLPHKRRVHFYAFMIEVHDRIHAREAEKGDPIGPVAAIIANDASVLCFDEFHITNIADAMILGRLFEALFDRGVVVVATSNRAPGELYEGGLQRERFLPFIELFKRKLDVLELGGERDYRRARLAGRQVYFTPADDRAYRALEHAFIELTGNASARAETLTVQGHDLVVPRAARGVAWFTFDALCGKTLGPADYAALCARYHIFIVEGVPRIERDCRDQAIRFNIFVDELYAAHGQIVVSAAVPPEALYTEGEGSFEFARTVSRLHEMQSAEYIAASIG